MTRRVALLILDGWGIAPPGPGNAVSLASTPNLDRLIDSWPKTSLLCSGRAVGLPTGFMGNSEVGHMNIGAGRVVWQDMTKIDLAIEDKSLWQNQPLNDLIETVKKNGSALHFMGLASDAGVHSHLNHLHALLEVCKDRGLTNKIYVHAFMDGRDTSPTSGVNFVEHLQEFLKKLGLGRVVTAVGRFYAMDRDKRWPRVEKAFDALTEGKGELVADIPQALREAYKIEETDEFIKPKILQENGKPVGRISDGDGVFFFNFRADRARELTMAFAQDDFSGFPRPKRPKLGGYVTMTEYEHSFNLPVAFPPQDILGTLGEVVSLAGLPQLRLAETEKYAHVTYFFNCGREDPFPGEERILIPSVRDVPTYDLKPQMSAVEITDTFLKRWNSGEPTMVVCNLANLDMVGHTGVIEAAIKACETVDGCVGRIAEAVLGAKGALFLTADHGNAEEMIDEHGGKMTAHTLNPVRLVLMDEQRKDARLRSDGKLGNIAPTILEVMGLEKSTEMTESSLLLK